MCFRRSKIAKVVALAIVGLTTSCATYYQTNQSFNQDFERGNLESALATLQADTKEANSKRQFLYFVNKGLVLSMMSRYEESNDYFEKAFCLVKITGETTSTKQPRTSPTPT